MDQTIKLKVGAKDFFLYLGAIVGLFWSSISFIQLLTEIINYRFPDAIEGFYNYGYTGTMRYAISSLIIVFPIFLLLSWLNQKEITKDVSKRDIWIRKWLILLTLFISGITVVIDLVIFLNTFLGGEITTRFVLKVVTVLIVALGVFGYYIWEIRTTDSVSTKRKLFAGIASGVVLVALVLGFLTVGSPSTQRTIRFDEQRLSDLQNVQYQIINYWQYKGALPETLPNLNDSISGFIAPVDPVTKELYTYEVVSNLEFRLCANFSLATPQPAQPIMTKPLSENAMNDVWEHGAGRACFTRVIDPQLYPPINQKRIPVPVR